MKKIIVLALAFIGLNAFAQEQTRNRHSGQDKNEMGRYMRNLTPEQRATLHTKKMTLGLELSENQQKQIYALNLEQANHREARKATFKANKESGQKPNKDDWYNQMINRLDHKIAYKNKIKSILKSDQYELWKKYAQRQNQHKRHQNHSRSRNPRQERRG